MQVKGHVKKVYKDLLNEKVKKAYGLAVQKLVSDCHVTHEPALGEAQDKANRDMFTSLNPVVKPNPVTGETKVRLVLVVTIRWGQR